MNVAVISMTRDRLAYSRHCFETLEQNAGCEFDWFILDQGSDDGTVEWLKQDWVRMPNRHLVQFMHPENVGICKGANILLDTLHPDRYDVVVRYDNDAEVTQPNTLKTCAQLAYDFGAIVAPRVNGLLNPPPTIRKLRLGDHILDETAILGGIFMCIPAFLFTEHGYRYNETSPLGSGDEAIVPWWRAHGGVCGYLRGFSVNHYEGTLAQRERYPEYEARKVRELAAC